MPHDFNLLATNIVILAEPHQQAVGLGSNSPPPAPIAVFISPCQKNDPADAHPSAHKSQSRGGLRPGLLHPLRPSPSIRARGCDVCLPSRTVGYAAAPGVPSLIEWRMAPYICRAAVSTGAHPHRYAPHTHAHTQCWSRQTQHGLGVCIGMHLVNGTVSGTADPRSSQTGQVIRGLR